MANEPRSPESEATAAPESDGATSHRNYSKRNPFDSSLDTKLGSKVTSAAPEKTVVTMPVDGNTQPFGALHGGATAALCESAASVAASAHATRIATEADPLLAVGTELSISHLKTATQGSVTATATAVHLGRRRTVHSVQVVDNEGRTIATALVTNMIIPV